MCRYGAMTEFFFQDGWGGSRGTESVGGKYGSIGQQLCMSYSDVIILGGGGLQHALSWPSKCAGVVQSPCLASASSSFAIKACPSMVFCRQQAHAQYIEPLCYKTRGIN